MGININTYAKWIKAIPILSGGLILGILVTHFFYAFNMGDIAQKKHVYVDVEQIISSVNKNLSQQLEANQIKENQINEKLVKAKNQFNIILDNYAIQHNAIILSSHKVIAGAENVTAYFTDEILAGLK